jgi:elongation factor P
MYSPTDLRKETIIDLGGVPYKVVEYAQKQMGRGGSIVNTKLKNLITGNVLDRTFRNDEHISPADITRENVQYLYSSNDTLHFMNTETFESVELQKSVDSNIVKYITEGGDIDALVFDGKIIGFEWPKNVILKVSNTAGGDKGNSASSNTKQAILETGISVAVPQFIKNGEMIKVDTRSGEYIERAK